MNKLFFISLLLLIGIKPLGAQNVNTLKERKEKNKKELDYTNRILKKVRSQQSGSLNELKVLKQSIKNRENTLKLHQEEIFQFDTQIHSGHRNIDNLTKKQDELKEIYGTLLSNAYFQSGTFDKWLYIFSAKGFRQAYNRYKYYEMFTDYTQTQLQRLNNLKDSIANQVITVEKLKSEKEKIAEKTKEEQKKLDRQREKQQTEINRLKSREKDLLSRLKVQQQRDKNLEAQIRKAIRRNVKNIQKKSVAVKKKDIQLGNSFQANKGKLPWPTSNGFISSLFGEHDHPVLSGVKVRNDGIDITTEQGSSAKAIFEGEISQIVSLPGLNNTVIIRHGNYLSVYANLVSLHVKKGDKIKTGGVLGKIATAKDGATILKLQIWKDTHRQNPLQWLRKK